MIKYNILIKNAKGIKNGNIQITVTEYTPEIPNKERVGKNQIKILKKYVKYATI